MLKKLFGRKIKKEVETIIAPLSGQVVPLEDVPDEAFAQKLVGEGIAIIPEEGKVVSPINGEVTMVFPTKHAIGLLSEKGLEVLIHIGIETVTMGGDGFVAHVKTGDKVKVGDLLIEFSMDLVKEKAKSTTSPIIITNFDRIDHLELGSSKSVKMEESILMKVDLKS
ncbi:PTS sugar transporter subunit IIA [Bacillus sp. OTU530]|uniref:PTS sugar transporter subunit IIA n=1 Tax=Bacillus sp. OTU530 TaxID=3043862 RepID=UPI00313C18F5